MTDVFVYGTLLLPAVRAAVMGPAARVESANLSGYARLCLRGLSYPAIVERRGAQVDGALLRGLSAGTVERLDAFEGDLYERRRVEVSLLGGHRAEASAYVLASHRHGLLVERAWNPARIGPAELAELLVELGLAS